MLDAKGYAYLTDFNVGKRLEKDGKVTGYAGTFAYMAPELFYAKGTRYDTTVDVWSLGVLMFRMLFGVVPWRMKRKTSEQEYLDAHANEFNHRAPKNDKVRQETIRWILRGKVRVPSGVSAEAADLLHHMIALPERRFNVLQMKRHKWFDGVDWDAVFKKTLSAPFIPDEKANVDAGLYVEDVFASKSKEAKLTPEEHYLFYDWNWVKPVYAEQEERAVAAGTFKRRKKPSKRSIVRNYPKVRALQERVHQSKHGSRASAAAASSTAASSSATEDSEEEEVQIKPVPELGREVRIGDDDIVDVRSLAPGHFDDMSSSSTACSSQDHSESTQD
jgi:serine/threonine protein kinase